MHAADCYVDPLGRAGIGLRMGAARGASREFGDAAGLVPVRDVDVGLLVDVASVGGAEECWGDVAGLQVVVCPLLMVGIVAEESYGGIVAIEDGDAAFKFRDDGVVAMEAYLAWAAQMLGDGADESSIEVEVAEAAVFAVAYEEQRLVVAGVEGEAVAAVEKAFGCAFTAIAGEVGALPAEAEDAGVAVSVGDEDAAIRGWNCGGDAPLVGSLEAGLCWGCDLLDY